MIFTNAFFDGLVRSCNPSVREVALPYGLKSSPYKASNKILRFWTSNEFLNLPELWSTLKLKSHDSKTYITVSLKVQKKNHPMKQRRTKLFQQENLYLNLVLFLKKGTSYNNRQYLLGFLFSLGDPIFKEFKFYESHYPKTGPSELGPKAVPS